MQTLENLLERARLHLLSHPETARGDLSRRAELFERQLQLAFAGIEGALDTVQPGIDTLTLRSAIEGLRLLAGT